MDRQQKINELESELRALRAEEEKFSKMPVEQQLATELHSILCTANHIDQCGWEYSSDWNDYSKKRYLEKATKLMAICPHQPISFIINFAKAIKES